MTRYISRRVLQMLMTLFLIMTILFILLKVTPGSPFTNPRISAETRAILEAKYGLDKPVLVQYAIYLGGLLRFDFGESIIIIKNYPVTKMIFEPLAITVRLDRLGAWIDCWDLLRCFSRFESQQVLGSFQYHCCCYWCICTILCYRYHIIVAT